MTDRPTSTTHAQFSQQQQNQQIMGTKRGRFLMRQPRVKRECDTNQNPEGEPLSPQYLSVPHLKIERQVSDPLPTSSPPPSSNLLTVPGGILMKQHSHPLLPSQLSVSRTNNFLLYSQSQKQLSLPMMDYRFIETNPINTLSTYL